MSQIALRTALDILGYLDPVNDRLDEAEARGIAPMQIAGSANALVASTDAMWAHSAGRMGAFVAGASNTGPATLNINAHGAAPIKDHRGADLVAGAIRSGASYLFTIVFGGGGYFEYRLLDSGLMLERQERQSDFTALQGNIDGVTDQVRAGLFAWESSKYVRPILLNGGDAVNGAAFYDGISLGATFKVGGIRVPPGQTGQNSYVWSRFNLTALDVSQWTGAPIRFAVAFRCSPDFLSAMNPMTQFVQSDGTAVQIDNSRLLQTSPTTFIWQFDGLLTGGNQSFVQAALLINGPVAPLAQAAWYAVDGLYLAPQLPGTNEAVEASRRIGASYIRTARIDATGAADFTSLASAFAAIGGGRNEIDRVRYEIVPGVYPTMDAVVPIYSDLVGLGGPGAVWIKGELPDDHPPADIKNHQTLWLQQSGSLRGLRVTCRNMRYPIHADFSLLSRIRMRLEGCEIEHLGNEGAKTHAAANGTGTVDSPEWAWGYGSRDGQRVHMIDTTLRARLNPLYKHNNAGFAEPSELLLEGCTIETTDAAVGWSLTVEALASGVVDRINLRGCQVNGPINYNAPTPIGQVRNALWSDRYSNIATTLTGGPCVPVIAVGGETSVLELRSVAGASSRVAIVGGTAAEPLFGGAPVEKRGSVGYAGRTFGRFMLSEPGAVNAIGQDLSHMSLAAALGDCRTVNKTLQVRFDGGATTTLTLVDDFRPGTNAQCLAILNSLLTAAMGNADRQFRIDTTWFKRRCPVFQPDHETVRLNTGTTAILKGQTVASDHSQARARVMTSADAAALFVGIALEDIPVGERGRVLKRGGVIHDTQAVFAFVAGWVAGEVYTVEPSQPGNLIEISGVSGSPAALLRVIEVRTDGAILALTPPS